MNETPQEDHLNLDKPNTKRGAEPSATETHQDSKSGNQPEYRLVPVQPWDSSTHGYNGYNADDEIDLVELLKTLWEERKTILLFSLTGAIIGLFFGFLAPREYTVTATLMPELSSESQGGASSLLRQFGGLAGLSGASLSQSNTIQPELYPEIVQTLPFQIELMNQEFYIPEIQADATLFTYFTEIKKPDGLSILSEWTLGLPGKVISVFVDKNENDSTILGSDNLSPEIYSLDKEQRKVVGILDKNITATLDKKTGIISLTTTLPDPVLTSNVAQYVIDQLTIYLTQYQTNKIKRDLAFTEQRLAEAKSRYEEAGLSLSEFQETQLGTASSRIRKGEQLLQSEYEIAFGIYSTLTQQFEQQKLKLQEETPVFKILQPVNLPSNPSSPSKILFLLGGFIFAGFLSLIVIFIKRSSWKSIFE